MKTIPTEQRIKDAKKALASLYPRHKKLGQQIAFYEEHLWDLRQELAIELCPFTAGDRLENSLGIFAQVHAAGCPLKEGRNAWEVVAMVYESTGSVMRTLRPNDIEEEGWKKA